MRALLGDAAVAQQHDPVAEAGRGQPVRDEQGCLPCRHAPVLLIDLILRNGVKRRRRLVEHEHRCVLIQGAGHHELLRLAAGQLNAVRIHLFIQVRIHAVRQGIQLSPSPAARRHCPPAPGPPQGRRRRRPSRPVKSRPCGPPETPERTAPHSRPGGTPPRDAVDPDRAGCRRIQPAQELDERRFARAVQANKRHMLPGTERKTDIVQRVMRRPVIAE